MYQVPVVEHPGSCERLDPWHHRWNDPELLGTSQQPKRARDAQSDAAGGTPPSPLVDANIVNPALQSELIHGRLAGIQDARNDPTYRTG